MQTFFTLYRVVRQARFDKATGKRYEPKIVGACTRNIDEAVQNFNDCDEQGFNYSLGVVQVNFAGKEISSFTAIDHKYVG